MPAALTPQEQIYIQRMNALLDRLDSRMSAIEKLTNESPEERGARVGVETAKDDDGKTFKRYAKQLQNPRFAAAFFPARKHAQLAVRRFHAGLPQRHLSKR